MMSHAVGACAADVQINEARQTAAVARYPCSKATKHEALPSLQAGIVGLLGMQHVSILQPLAGQHWFCTCWDKRINFLSQT